MQIQSLHKIFMLVVFFMSITISMIGTSLADSITNSEVKDRYTLDKFISESIDKYTGLSIAALNVKKLAYESDKAMSQLGWVLTSQGGYSKNASTLGIQSDTVDFGVGLEKQLESGHTVSLTGRYEHTDSEQVLFGLSPNPSDTTNIDLNYRIPLLEGSDNLQYQFDLNKADIERKIAELDKQKIKEELILQLIDIFYVVATIDSRLDTAKKSILRAKRLRKHIHNNIELGLLEKGEILQIDSQIYTLKLEYQKILDLKEKQVIAINRFLKRPYAEPFVVDVLDSYHDRTLTDSAKIFLNVKNHNYDVAKLRLQAELLDSALSLSRNREKDKLDLVMSMGVQNRSGNTSTGSIDDTDTTGMIRFEYRNALDKRAFSANRLQIQIDRETNSENLASVSDDLKYDTYNLINQIEKSKKLVSITSKRIETEQKKYNDILKRFKNGRSTTNIVIQFDNERIRAELDFDTERFELARRINTLRIKQGSYTY